MISVTLPPLDRCEGVQFATPRLARTEDAGIDSLAATTSALIPAGTFRLSKAIHQASVGELAGLCAILVPPGESGKCWRG